MTTFINASASSGLVQTADTSAILGLQTNGTTALTIDTSANVGIGTTSPTQKLDVSSTARFGSTYNSTYIVNNGATNTSSQIGDNATFGAGTAYGINSSSAYLYAQTGGTERMRISSGGYVTMPYQPCFIAYRVTTQTGTSPFTIVFDTAPVNVGSGYSTSTGRFTAPVTGNYHFTFQTLGIVTSWSTFDVFSYKNGASTPTILSTRPTSTSGADNASALSTSVGICNLTAGDYIEMKVANTSIYSDGNAWLKFMGFLIG